jgi:hypothetical protein
MNIYKEPAQKQKSEELVQKKKAITSANLTGIPDEMKSRFENLSGLSFDDVRVHYNSGKPAELQALAYTQGNQVYVAPGQETHLGHELGHVVQQKQGIVYQTTTVAGLPVNDNSSLEQTADILSARGEASLPLHGIVQRRELGAKDIDPEKTVPDQIIAQILIAANRYERLSGLLNIFSVSKNAQDFGHEMVRLYQNLAHAATETLDGHFLTLMQSMSPVADTATEAESMKINGLRGMFENDRAFTAPSGITDTDGVYIKYGRNFSSIVDMLMPRDVTDLISCITRLNKICDAEGITNTIEGAYLNVNQEILINTRNEDEKRIRSNLFITRLKSMTAFLEATAEGKQNDWGSYKIVPTGSDPHSHGRQAIYLRSIETGQVTRVFKPRSTQPDKALTDNIDSMLSFLNGFIPEENEKLKTMSFHRGDEEEFMQKSGDKATEALTPEVAKSHFRKLGRLHIAASVLGVMDLHCDNIVFTPEGPVIIDAECSFADFSGSQIEGPDGPGHRRNDSARLGAAASLFYVNTSTTEVPDIRTSVELFSDDESDYKKEYNLGKKNMIETIKSKKDGVRRQYKDKLQRIDKIRLVPIATETLGVNLMAFSYEGVDVLNTQYTKLLETLRLDQWIFHQAEVPLQLDETVSKDLFRIAFEAGTIPSFELDMSTDPPAIKQDGSIISINMPTKDAIINKALEKYNAQVDALFVNRDTWLQSK